jgi:broad specificity phosphatase PhoE
MAKLYLMRHGETQFNALKKIQGWSDSPLTSVGVQQAEVAKAYFTQNNIHFTHAYCSTAERASDTLELITNQAYTRLKDLREMGFGVFESEPERLNPPFPYLDYFVKYGGESQDMVRERMNHCVTEIMQKPGHESVLVVSHGAAVANFYIEWENYSSVKRTKRVGNCSIFIYNFDGNEFVLEEIVEHSFDHIA